MSQIGRVHRTYKEHNRWMYIPEVREKITVMDVVNTLLIALSIGACIGTMVMLMVIPLIV